MGKFYRKHKWKLGKHFVIKLKHIIKINWKWK